MKCPTCKNHIDSNSSECEWCGVSLDLKSSNIGINKFNHLASEKALKYTIYFVCIALSLLLMFTEGLETYPAFLFVVFVIFIIELYTYLKNRFSK